MTDHQPTPEAVELPELPTLPQPDVYDPGRFGVAWGDVKVVEYAKSYAREAVRAALARQAPAPLSQAVPEGFWLAPMEPEETMLTGARDWSIAKLGKAVGNEGAAGCYAAMRDSWLSRHPQPQAVTEDARDGERKS